MRHFGDMGHSKGHLLSGTVGPLHFHSGACLRWAGGACAAYKIRLAGRSAGCPAKFDQLLSGCTKRSGPSLHHWAVSSAGGGTR